MKKVVSLVLALALATTLGSSSWAATTATSYAKLKAYAVFGAVDLQFNVSLFNYDSSKSFINGYSGTQATEINFAVDQDVNGNAIVLGSATEQYAKAGQIAFVESNLAAVAAGTKIFMYTDNKNGTNGYKTFIPRTQVMTYGGADHTHVSYGALVKKDAQSSQTTAYTDGDIQGVRVRVMKASVAQNGDDNTQKITEYPNLYADDTLFGNGKRTLIDINDTIDNVASSANLETESSKNWAIGRSGAGGGVWIGYGEYAGVSSNWFANEKAVIFFNVAYNNLVGGSRYGTEMIQFATVTE